LSRLTLTDPLLLEEDFVLDETQTTLCKPKSIPSTAQEESTLEFSDNIRFNSLAETSMAESFVVL
jgi:hypothetical protein